MKRPTFDYWRRRIKPEALPPKRNAQGAVVRRMTLVSVQVEREAESPPVVSVVLKSPGGWQVSVSASVDIERLAILLRCLP